MSSATTRLSDPGWAWAPYQPDTAQPWTLQQAGHLYRRAAFGANWNQLQQALRAGPQRTVDKLLRPEADVAAFNQAYDQYEQAAASGAANGAIAWWLRRMIETPHPLQEQMTLCWHNYFAISNDRVNNTALMCRYVSLLRSQALGQFDALLTAIVNEPAVFMCLDARANRRARPTNHFARLLLEHFTVGPGRFSESDVQATARAFTGWFVSQEQLRYTPREHDPGSKTILGQSGEFGSKDVVRLLLTQPATSQFVVRKLYRWLISETSAPTDPLLAPLAVDFSRDFNLARIVEVMLRSNLFFSPAAHRQKIKSPVEFALGIIRPFGATVPTLRLASDLADLGQDLYGPPTIKGWAGGRCWINRLTLLGRARLAQSLLSSSGVYEGKLDPLATAARHDFTTPESRAAFLSDLLLQDRPTSQTLAASAPVATAGSDPRILASRLAGSPEFQLS